MSARRYQTVAVTGAGGFVGRHVVRHLLGAADAPARVAALDVREGPAADRLSWVRCDLADAAQVGRALAEVRPDGVIHLAAISQGDDLGAYFAVNVQGCQNLLAAAAAMPAPPRVLVVGSAAEYGITSGGHEVVDEARPLLAATPYGVSKVLQERWALVYAAARAVPVVCVRPFNIIGPGQPPSLVPAAFLAQVADVLDGRAAEVRVGNTSTWRDFTDVRDVAAALWALLGAADHVLGEVYNIASGEPVRIADLLEACVRLGGRAIPVREDPARRRAADVPTLVGDSGKLRAATGWRPAIPWRQSLQDMWQDMRAGAAEAGS